VNTEPIVSVGPKWETVLDRVIELSSTRTSFSGPSGRPYCIERYERDWRIMISTPAGTTRWVDLDDIRGCWEIFERLGRIESEDVLDPGRCSSLMMALFLQVSGVSQDGETALTLV
jgi:hypothetical protein